MSHDTSVPTGSNPSSIDQALLDQLLLEEGFAAAAGAERIPARADQSRAPLTFAQELLWLLDRATPGLTAYNMALARRVRGALDVPALCDAVSVLAQRHAVFRTRFVADGEAWQVVDPLTTVACEVVDFRAHGAPEAVAEQFLRTRPRTRFDLTRDHLLRAVLVRVSDTDHIFFLETHHIICDGWSVGLIFRELDTLYRAIQRREVATLVAPEITFGDFAAWQRERLRGGALESLLEFWRGHLADAAEPLALPTDHPRASAPSFDGGRVVAMLPPAVLDAIKALGQRHNATLYMTLLAAYMTVLHRYTGRATVLVGSAVAGRTQPETEAIVGYLSNTLVQRGDFAGDPTFAQLLMRVRDDAIASYDHQDAPLEKIALDMHAERATPAAPLFEVVFTMQDTIAAPAGLGELSVSGYPLEVGATKFDLTLLPSETEQGLRLALQYRSDLFAAETAERLLGHLITVLRAAAEDADRKVSLLPILTPGELATLAAWNATDIDMGPSVTTLDVVRTQFQRVPSRTAVVGRDGQLTYAELERAANQLARHLRATGAVRGARIGLLLDRSSDAIVALLGIIGADAAYVPLLPDTPAPRLAEQIRESGVQIVVTAAAYVPLLPRTITAVCLDRDAGEIASRPTTPIESQTRPSDEAYVLFTSGSTGVPKGVAVTHANVVHYTRAISRVLAEVPAGVAGDGLAALDGWHFALVSTLGADLGNTCLFPALCAGGTLHVLPHEVVTDPARYAAYDREHSIDVMKITPSHMRALVAEWRSSAGALLPRRALVLGGETLTWDFAESLLDAGTCRVVNHYGPTETTVGASTFEVTASSMHEFRPLTSKGVPIGRPLANVRYAILDRAMQQTAVGVPGELFISGDGVAAGYVGRDELTARAFVALADGRRAYRTGDLARWRPGGVVEFLGRADRQVKIRGYRVELGDIEHALARLPMVAQAVVVADSQPASDVQLIAYVVLRPTRRSGYAAAHVSSESDVAADAAAALAQQLPDHMRPSAIICLDAIPLTANGKVDTAKLPRPGAASTSSGSRFVEPRTETERGVAAIWSEVLKKEQVGVADDFIELGGHSLLAIRILGKITRQFGVRLPLRTLFDAPTVEQLSVVINHERAAAPPTAAQIPANARDAFRIGGAQPSTGASGAGEQR